MKKYRPLVFAVLCFLVAVLLAGCSLFGGEDTKLTDKKDNGTPSDNEKNDSGTGGAGSRGTIEVVLYFAAPDSDKLVAEVHKIPKVPGLARATINELIKGPASGSKLQKTVPQGTRLLDINIKKGLCTVNFSREIQENHWGGSTGEMITIFSIVNTLTQFSDIEKVTFMVAGEPVETLVGHADLSVPVSRNDSFIKP